ncbi:hypothetical protein BDV40DRAFT_258323, partial [Aspergillus tamarii]
LNHNTVRKERKEKKKEREWTRFNSSRDNRGSLENVGMIPGDMGAKIEVQKLMVPERLELSTSELLAQHSNRLSYGTNC